METLTLAFQYLMLEYGGTLALCASVGTFAIGLTHWRASRT